MIFPCPANCGLTGGCCQCNGATFQPPQTGMQYTFGVPCNGCERLRESLRRVKKWIEIEIEATKCP